MYSNALKLDCVGLWLAQNWKFINFEPNFQDEFTMSTHEIWQRTHSTHRHIRQTTLANDPIKLNHRGVEIGGTAGGWDRESSNAVDSVNVCVCVSLWMFECVRICLGFDWLRVYVCVCVAVGDFEYVWESVRLCAWLCTCFSFGTAD